MAKKKTTEAINREQEAMEEKEALPSFFICECKGTTFFWFYQIFMQLFYRKY